MNNIKENAKFFTLNEIDNIYMNLLSLIAETSDKIDLRDLKKEICDKYKFFLKIPMTIVLIGVKTSGKTSLIHSLINSIRATKHTVIDFTPLSKYESNTSLIIYENSDDGYFHIIKRKNKENVASEEISDVENVTLALSNQTEDDYDELVVKVPGLSVSLQFVDTPNLSDNTISMIEASLPQTSVPIFLLVNSSNFDTKCTEKYYDTLRSVYNKFSYSYFYLILTNTDLFEEKNEIHLTNMRHFTTSLEKYDLKFFNVLLMHSKQTEMILFLELIDYLKKFNHDNIAILRIEYFKCLLKSCVNKFSLLYSKKRKTQFCEVDNFKKKYPNASAEFDKKMNEFFAQLPRDKDGLKKNYPLWYNSLKSEMKQNDKEISKNKFINRKHFMSAHLELIKLPFEAILQEYVKKLIIDILPLAIFPSQSFYLSSDALLSVKTNYQFGTFLGIWTKSGVYSDIVIKMFKRLGEHKSSVIWKCKELFDSSYNLKLEQIESTNKTNDIVKNLLKIIDTQALSPRNIQILAGKPLLVKYLKDHTQGPFANIKQFIENI